MRINDNIKNQDDGSICALFLVNLQKYHGIFYMQPPNIEYMQTYPTSPISFVVPSWYL